MGFEEIEILGRIRKEVILSRTFDFGEGKVPAYVCDGEHGNKLGNESGIVQEGTKIPKSTKVGLHYRIGGKNSQLGRKCRCIHSGTLLYVKSGNHCLFHATNAQNSIFGHKNELRAENIKNCIFEDNCSVLYPVTLELCIVREGTHIHEEKKPSSSLLIPEIDDSKNKCYYGEEIFTGNNNEIITRKLSSKEIDDLKRRLEQQFPAAFQKKKIIRNTLGLRRRFGGEGFSR